MRILIVEDERRLAEALGQIMAEQRYQADVVFDGADGLDYALTGQYDAIVLDVMLPKVDGFEVARRLRLRPRLHPHSDAHRPGVDSDKIAGLDHGADDYMTKPFDIGELLARVRALTRRQGEVIGEQLAAGDRCWTPPPAACAAGKNPSGWASRSSTCSACCWPPPGPSFPRRTSSPRYGAWSRRRRTTTWRSTSPSAEKAGLSGSRVSIGTVRKVGYHLEVPAV